MVSVNGHPAALSFEDLISLDGQDYVVARDPETRVKLWEVSQEPGSQEDLFPFAEPLSFGFSGFGQSIWAGLNEASFFLGMNPEVWGELAPGLEHGVMGLQLTSPVAVLEVANATGFRSEPYDSGTGTDGGGALPWTTPGNVAAADAVYATRSLANLETSNDLRVQGFGATLAELPSGLRVEVRGSYTGGLAGFGPVLSAQVLGPAGTPVGAVKSAPLPQTTDSYVSLGGPGDMWGQAQALSDYGDADFGVRLSVAAPTGAAEVNVKAVAGAAANDATAGGVAWSDPASALQDSGAEASATVGAVAAEVATRTTAGTSAQSSSGLPVWVNPEHAQEPGGSAATVSMTPGQRQSEWLTLSNYGFSLGAGLTPVGVEVQANLSKVLVGYTVEAQLVQGGAPVGAVKAVPVAGGFSGVKVIGGPSDTWAAALTREGVNAASFGVRLRVVRDDDTTSSYFSLFDAAIVVHGQPSPTTTQWLLLTAHGFAVPGSGTLSGVQVKTNSNTGIPADVQVQVQLVVGGVRVGNVLTATGDSFDRLVGGHGELFGVALTPAQVNAAGFGVAVRCVPTAAGSRTVALDFAEVTVFFTQPYTWDVRIDHVRLSFSLSPEGRFLYVGAGPTLTKLRYGLEGDVPSFPVESTEVFNHSTSGAVPRVQTMTLLKAGGGNGNALIGFERDAPLVQINQIEAGGPDSYKLPHSAGEVYAGQLGTAHGPNNTERLVWRSLGFEGENVGAFSRITPTPITAAAKDYTLAASWPDAPFQVGRADTSVNKIVEYQRGVTCTTPEGVYLFDQNFNSYPAYSMVSSEHPDNGINAVPFERTLIIPAADLERLDDEPHVGLSKLIANKTPVKGRVTAAAVYREWLYIAVWNGMDAYIVKARRPLRHEQVPQHYCFFPQHRILGGQSRAMIIRPDNEGVVWLFYGTYQGGFYDVGWCILAEEQEQRRTPGVWESSIRGDPTKLTYIERSSWYGVDCSATDYYRPFYRFDDGPWIPFGSEPLNQSGRMTRSTDPASTPSGYHYQVRLESVLANHRSNPILRGIASNQQGLDGGPFIEGQRQADTVLRFEVGIRLAQNQHAGGGGLYPGDAPSQWDQLVQLQGRVVPVVFEDHHGDRRATTARITSVTYAMGAQHSPDVPSERIAKVKGRALLV